MTKQAKAIIKTAWNLNTALPWLLLIAGLVGVFASLSLSIENIDRLKNPGSAASCDLSPIISCSSVTKSAQAELLGFPNPYLGLPGFGAVAAIGLALLAGARFKRWFWLLINGGLLLATVFIHYLAFQSLYRIGALCVFCMAVWTVIIPAFLYTTLHNARSGNIKLPKKYAAVASFVSRHHIAILVIWFAVFVLLIGKRFWYYWNSLL